LGNRKYHKFDKSYTRVPLSEIVEKRDFHKLILFCYENNQINNKIHNATY